MISNKNVRNIPKKVLEFETILKYEIEYDLAPHSYLNLIIFFCFPFFLYIFRTSLNL